MTIPLDRFSNSALTTLAAGMDNVTNPATMVVASAVGFPTAGSYRVLVGTELMQVTAGAGTTSWTVNRAVESTTIATHAITDSIVHVATAFEMNSMVQTFNPLAYGAKADNLTDDVVAFQNAVNDAHAAAPGGWVFVPTFAYKIGSALTTYANVVFLTYGATFSGAGSGSVAPLVNVSLLGGLSLPVNLTVLSGGITITGNSTITGTLGGITTLTATSFVGALTGNATTAAALQTARAINGVNFDGTAAITVTAAAGTLTGATLATNVLTSSLTSTGILASLHMTSPVIDSGGLGITAGNLSLTAGTYSQSDATTTTGTSHLITNTTITSGSILQLTQNASAMSGTGLLMNLATSGTFTGKFLDLQVNGSSKFSIDSFGHIISGATGVPGTSNLGANVTSATFTGNDTRGTIAIVMSAGLAANTRCFTATFANSYGATAPKITLVDQTSTAGLAIVNSYVQAQSTGVSFDVAFDQALVAGTYTLDYIVIG